MLCFLSVSILHGYHQFTLHHFMFLCIIIWYTWVYIYVSIHMDKFNILTSNENKWRSNVFFFRFVLIIVMFSCFLCRFQQFNGRFPCRSIKSWTIDDRVPLGFRQFREGPEFCSIFMKLKTRSSPALLWGMHNTNFASIDEYLLVKHQLS